MYTSKNLVNFLASKNVNQSKKTFSRQGSQSSFKDSRFRSMQYQDPEQIKYRKIASNRTTDNNKYEEVNNTFTSNSKFKRSTQNQTDFNWDTRSYKSRQKSIISNQLFQTSRYETKQCLQKLSRRIQNEIIHTENIFNEFNDSLKKVIEIQFQKFKQLIRGIVQNAFSYTEQFLKKMYANQQKNIKYQIKLVDDKLQQMYDRLQKMKQIMETNNWKKVTGVVLVSDLQKQVDQLILDSQKLSNFRKIKLQADAKKLTEFEKILQELLELNLSVVNPKNKGYYE